MKSDIWCHDLVRRLDRQGEVLIWCRKCSGYATQRMGPNLMNCCKPEHVGTKEHGKMLKRFQVLEDGSVPAKEAKNWRIERRRRRITGKEYRTLLNEFEVEGLMAQTGLWNLAREKRLQDRGALPSEEGGVNRKYNAMHEENFLSSWLKEDLVGKEEGKEEVKRKGER